MLVPPVKMKSPPLEKLMNTPFISAEPILLSVTVPEYSLFASTSFSDKSNSDSTTGYTFSIVETTDSKLTVFVEEPEDSPLPLS